MRILFALFLLTTLAAAQIDINRDTKGILGRTRGGTGVNSASPFAVTGVDINSISQVTSVHLSGLTNTAILRANSSGNVVNGSCTDDLTTITCSGSGGLVTPLVTTNGTGPDTYGNQTAPSTPTTGSESIWTDSTDKRFHDKNDAGTIGTTVVANAGATHNFLTSISAAGVVAKAQPSFSDLSDYRSQIPPVVQSCGGTTSCSATLGASPMIILDVVTLAAGTATVTGFSPAFSSSSTFHCLTEDFTTPTNGSKVSGGTASSITITGTGTDLIQYVCIGY